MTKSGTDALHGDLFEFLRNTDLDANNLFLNETGHHADHEAKPVWGNNRRGDHHRRLYFGSYQGTRQVDGEGAGSLESVVLPPLTNNRTAATLGSEFCGETGKNGGVGVACDGSNINPIALSLLNLN